MAYELWSLSTGNAVAEFSAEVEALRFIAEAVRQYGRAYGEDLLLGREDDDGESHLIAQSADLVELALSTPAPPRVPA